ncbi:uncharacterized protein B0H18DRAFT_1124943 [Fomitopsis serialis]|uniref:uncharacterized protein n=1 Tax=Fomitopsis serialis TaxID=139415 RepID=UPI0020081167|nr:uncharacterized protein B0H18DRAFT_1124943 [Neoantrodia serialis]KAH9915355.1 hypothetical protein B0H18DRAFT_1124943 [Neoantrodia serialis]
MGTKGDMFPMVVSSRKATQFGGVLASTRGDRGGTDVPRVVDPAWAYEGSSVSDTERENNGRTEIPGRGTDVASSGRDESGSQAQDFRRAARARKDVAATGIVPHRGWYGNLGGDEKRTAGGKPSSAATSACDREREEVGEFLMAARRVVKFGNDWPRLHQQAVHVSWGSRQVTTAVVKDRRTSRNPAICRPASLRVEGVISSRRGTPHVHTNARNASDLRGDTLGHDGATTEELDTCEPDEPQERRAEQAQAFRQGMNRATEIVLTYGFFPTNYAYPRRSSPSARTVWHVQEHATSAFELGVEDVPLPGRQRDDDGRDCDWERADVARDQQGTMIAMDERQHNEIRSEVHRQSQAEERGLRRKTIAQAPEPRSAQRTGASLTGWDRDSQSDGSEKCSSESLATDRKQTSFEDDASQREQDDFRKTARRSIAGRDDSSEAKQPDAEGTSTRSRAGPLFLPVLVITSGRKERVHVCKDATSGVSPPKRLEGGDGSGCRRRRAEGDWHSGKRSDTKGSIEDAGTGSQARIMRSVEVKSIYCEATYNRRTSRTSAPTGELSDARSEVTASRQLEVPSIQTGREYGCESTDRRAVAGTARASSEMEVRQWKQRERDRSLDASRRQVADLDGERELREERDEGTRTFGRTLATEIARRYAKRSPASGDDLVEGAEDERSTQCGANRGAWRLEEVNKGWSSWMVSASYETMTGRRERGDVEDRLEAAGREIASQDDHLGVQKHYAEGTRASGRGDGLTRSLCAANGAARTDRVWKVLPQTQEDDGGTIGRGVGEAEEGGESQPRMRTATGVAEHRECCGGKDKPSQAEIFTKEPNVFMQGIHGMANPQVADVARTLSRILKSVMVLLAGALACSGIWRHMMKAVSGHLDRAAEGTTYEDLSRREHDSDANLKRLSTGTPNTRADRTDQCQEATGVSQRSEEDGRRGDPYSSEGSKADDSVASQVSTEAEVSGATTDEGERTRAQRESGSIKRARRKKADCGLCAAVEPESLRREASVYPVLR